MSSNPTSGDVTDETPRRVGVIGGYWSEARISIVSNGVYIAARVWGLFLRPRAVAGTYRRGHHSADPGLRFLPERYRFSLTGLDLYQLEMLEYLWEVVKLGLECSFLVMSDRHRIFSLLLSSPALPTVEAVDPEPGFMSESG